MLVLFVFSMVKSTAGQLNAPLHIVNPLPSSHLETVAHDVKMTHATLMLTLLKVELVDHVII